MYFNGQTVHRMKVTLRTMISQVWGRTSGRMGGSIAESGRTTKWKGRDTLNGKTGEFMTGTMPTTKKKVGAYSHDLMGRSMKGSG